MAIGRLKSINALRQRGGLEDLSELGVAVNLAAEQRAAADTDDWGEFPGHVRREGHAAAAELLRFLDDLPAKAGARGHLHFATGLADAAIVIAGSAAEAAARYWSDHLSKAVSLASYDFSLLPLDPPDVAKAKFEELAALLDDEIDTFIAERLLLFGIGGRA